MKKTLSILMFLPLLVMAATAEAYLVGGKACHSWIPGVTTPDTRWISTPCYPNCFVGLSVGDTYATAFAVWFNHSYKNEEDEVVKFTGPVSVAVMSNDSRINPPYMTEITLGTLTGTNKLSNWRLPFNGLKPGHYYALMTYSPGDDRYGINTPISRKCFWTSCEGKTKDTICK